MRNLTLSLTGGFAQTKFNSSVFRWNVAIVVCIAMLAATYLWQINSLSTRGYEIKKIEKDLTILQSQQKHLEMEVSNLQSINRIESASERLNYVPATGVTYIKDANYALK